MSYFVTSDGCNLYYEDHGEGEPVVLIHGWSCSHQHWRKQVPELREKHRVIIYDLRGHGNSDCTENGLTLPQFGRDLKELLSYLNLKKVTLVGWSMGTQVIFEYIKQFGCNNLAKVCFIDMTPKLITDNQWELGLYGKFTHQDNLALLGAFCENWEGVAEQFIPNIYNKTGNYDKTEVKWAIELAKKNTPHVMVSLWIAMAIGDYRDVLAKITIPALIAYGEESALYAPAVSEYMRDHIQDARLIAFAGCGHYLFSERSAYFNQLLDEFIAFA